MEGLVTERPPRAEESPVQRALVELATAEAAAAYAKEKRAAAAAEKLRLQAQMSRLRREKMGAQVLLPYHFEEIDEICARLMKAEENVGLKAASRVALGVVLLALLLRWRTDGPLGVVSCVLLPLPCAIDGVSCLMDTQI